MKKRIYHFSKNNAEGASDQIDILGGKGAGLAGMCKLGLPIPPGFTISTEMCRQFFDRGNRFDEKFKAELDIAIEKLEAEAGKKFGCINNPLLISVRSGAAISMPGMMDTILNLGINDEVALALAKKTGNQKFALDSYRRFLEMYGSVVLEVSSYLFEEHMDDVKTNAGIFNDNELEVEHLQEIIDRYKKIIKNLTQQDFQSDPKEQLKQAIGAVFRSWNSPRAKVYRRINNMKENLGTAVNIQSMVYGNMGENSATGVVFSRNPVTGENKPFGEFLINAQGEDVVAGVRTPSLITENGENNNETMQKVMPEIYEKLVKITKDLEEYYVDMQDIEFTIEEKELYILQTRSGKRSARSAIKIAVDMEKEGKISRQEAILRIEPESINQLLHTTIVYDKNTNIIAKGLPASPGAATGIVVFNSHDAEELSLHHKVILVRNDTSPEDIRGMHVSQAIVTARGGMTSHAAVVARGMGCPCVCGVKDLKINEQEQYLVTSNGLRVNQGDTITIDGSSGNIMIGHVELVLPTFSEEFKTMLNWADEIKQLKVRTNAETPADISTALRFGAVGIGLCRTEHMFFEKNKIELVRQMIIAQEMEAKMQAIAKLKPLQIADFEEIFRLMNGLPVNIRLLDPPLHEFLPSEKGDIDNLAKIIGVSPRAIEYRLQTLHEHNPMLGHRGCRLGVTSPEIYNMQIDAMIEAMTKLQLKEGIVSNLEIMVPLVSDVAEFIKIKSYITARIASAEEQSNIKLNITIGTMIELPRAALLAGKIAPHVDFFSFGTNDLTQTTFGISRDDIGSFLPSYLDEKIFKADPFAQLDQEGVGKLIEMAVEAGRKSNQNLKMGVCGEHAGNPESIEFFNKIGLDYISCSPFRVSIAQIAAAQSKIRQKML